MKNPTKKHFDQHRRFKDINWNAPLKLLFWILFASIAITLGVVLIGALLTGCQKESSFTSGKVIQSDRDLVPPGGYSLTKREVTPELIEAAKKTNPGKGKGKPSQPPTDTTGSGGDTTYNPPTSNSNLLYLDFDGETLSGTYWNTAGDFAVNYSGLTAAEIDTVINRTKAEYEGMGFTVTTDRAQFFLGAASHRQQAIVTESWEWYGQAGGVAYIGSYAWSAPQPCFVFSSLLSYSGKYVADAAIHEIGHTLGLYHVPQPDGSSAYATYGNYMGVAYYVPRGIFESNVKDSRGGYVDQLAQIASNK